MRTEQLGERWKATGDVPGGEPDSADADDAAELGAIIGGIYDAATAPELWPRVLDSCREFVGGLSATIFAKNVTGSRGQVYSFDGRLAIEHAQSYFEQYAPIDPTNTLQVFGEIDHSMITSQMLDIEEFTNSRFAREWALPRGLVDMVVAPIERRGSWAALFGVFRHERDGMGDATAGRRVSLLAPHIRRSVAIGDILSGAQAEAGNFRDAVDGLAAGVFIIDAKGRVLHVNDAGRRFLASTGSLSKYDDAIRLDGTLMRELLPKGVPVTGSTTIETAQGDRYAAHMLPLAGRGRQFWGGLPDAVAAVFVLPAAFDPPAVPEILAKAFELTAGELRVVLATIRHEGVAEISEALGIAETTVRTHLHRIFSKTETRRQADIVKLVAGFASPLSAR